MLASTSRDFGPTHNAWRLWALSVVLGIVGMHGLAVGPGAGELVLVTSAAAVHPTAKGALDTLATSPAPSRSVHTEHVPGQMPPPVTKHHGGDGDVGMVLCVVLLLVFAAAAFAQRREAWVSVLARKVPARFLRLAPITLALTPMTRFTVMRC